MTLFEIVEVAFDDYVRRPENRHNTNILRTPKGKENEIGTASFVDTLEETANGVVATKVYKGARHRSLYPWSLVKDVKYASEVLPEPPSVLEEAVDFAPAKKVKVA